MRVTISEVDRTPPEFSSPSIIAVAEHARLRLPIRMNKPVQTAAIAEGPHAARFEVFDAGIHGWFLCFAGDGTVSGPDSFSVDVVATDAAGNTARETVRVGVDAGNPDRNQIRNVYNQGLASWLPTDETDMGAVRVEEGRIVMTCDSPGRSLGCMRQFVAVAPGANYRVSGSMALDGLPKSAGRLELSLGSAMFGVKPLKSVVGSGPFSVDFVANAPYVWVRLKVASWERRESTGTVTWSDLKITEEAG